MALFGNHNNSPPRNYLSLYWTITSINPQANELQPHLSCCWLASVFGSSSTDSSIILEGTYSTLLVSFLEYFNQKQDILKPKSDFIGSHWSPCQRKRSICNYIFNANINCPTLLKNHEKWASSLQDSRNIHYSKNLMRLKRVKLHLRNSLALLRCFYCSKQHAKIANW